MKQRNRSWLGWAVSLLMHALLLFLVVPESGGTAGEGMRILEVGLVELPGVVQAGPATPAQAAVTPPAPAPAPKPVPKPAPKPAPAGIGDKTPVPKPAPATTPAVTTPAAPSSGKVNTAPPADLMAGTPGTPTAAGNSPGFGSGEGLVLNRPIQTPKSAQNAGHERTVRLAVGLKPGERLKVKILASSGDTSLDRYAERVVAERWQFAVPPTPVRLAIALVFRSDQVEVIFDRCEAWSGEDL